ncbi:ABC transporter ATP-binding protein [Desulfonema ishimotonii]|uniref:ABC transporter ATP-binding protein n=1 Tax=Desulfonema ishimotonii TaxID=45657 RepID=A0A401FUA1_9BACT|nr:ABC transporter ATP-binding protein [Desulfonema ishimotonii]GBC60518.1 ABC transporter ATP-binding protein [Desulfonema ishimotonii]
MTNSQPLLKIEKISKAFGGVQALSDISFEVNPDMVLGLIGPNGAGKTTLFNVITGAYVPSRGQVVFDGRPVQGKKIHDVVRLGVARTFQNVELFDSMTAIENVMVGCHVRTKSGVWGAITRLPGARREERRIREQAMNLLEFVGLENHADRKSSDLPFGWQRLLEIARALASEPRLMLMDEPAAGLNAVETRQLGELIYKIRERGVTLMLVEHDMSLTMKVSDRIVVLDRGRMLAQGTPREVQADEAVMAAYLGKQ